MRVPASRVPEDQAERSGAEPRSVRRAHYKNDRRESLSHQFGRGEMQKLQLTVEFSLGWKMRHYRNDCVLRGGSADFGAAVFNRHVQFAAYAEAPRKIDSRFDREAGALDQRPMVLGFERIEIRSCAMDLAAN